VFRQQIHVLRAQTAVGLLGVALTLGACGNGQGYVLRAPCEDDSKLTLEYRKSMRNFEMGPSLGYRLSWARQERPPLELYNNGIGPTSRYDLAWYVGWPYRSGPHSTPQPTYDFTPLPAEGSGADTQAFERPLRTYDSSLMPWRHETPPLMNIFLDPAEVSLSDFSRIKACLAAHRTELNQAMQGLASKLGKNRYLPLRLGGVVRGLPRYADPAFQRTMRAVWGEDVGDRPLPNIGRFSLYDGETASGNVAGHYVEVRWQGGQRIETVDGHPYEGGQIGEGVCANHDFQHCAKTLTANSEGSDGSMSYLIAAQIAPRVFALETPQ
jgi:hypothetical protein